MHRFLLSFLSSLLAFVGASSQAQTATDAPASPADSTQLTESNGVKYLNGGASEEDRNRMLAQTSDYPVRIALSGKGGEYVVANMLTLSNAAGNPVATVPNAGPFVMFNLPPGQYTADVTLSDGEHERRRVQVGSAAQTLDWNFPQAPK